MGRDLVKCRYCGSLVSKKKLQNHMKRIHAGNEERGLVPESLVLKAMRLLDYSPKKGFKFLRKLELGYPPNADVYYNMGVALLHLNRLQNAARYFEKTLQLEGDHEYAKRNLDLTERVMRLLFKECTEDDLEEAGTLANWARDGGLFDLALRLGRIMIDVDGEKIGALNDLGLTYQAQKKFDEAIEYYDKALEIQPDMFEALSNKGLCMLHNNRLGEAYMLYKRSVELRPDFLQGWYHLGYININRRNYDEALRCLNIAIELNDEYYLAWIAKYWLLRKMNRMEEAEECLQRAVDLNPEYVAKVLSGENMKFHKSNMQSKPQSRLERERRPL